MYCCRILVGFYFLLRVIAGLVFCLSRMFLMNEFSEVVHLNSCSVEGKPPTDSFS